jgi:hypothetical protein
VVDIVHRTDFLNHSCDSHLWLEDEVTLSVRRAVDTGGEVTVDYALWGTDTEFPCRCESPACRGALRQDQVVGNVIRPP